MKATGSVFKYGDNVDTDVIIPARYLNITDGYELAKHCMEDIDVYKRQFADCVTRRSNTRRHPSACRPAISRESVRRIPT